MVKWFILEVIDSSLSSAGFIALILSRCIIRRVAWSYVVNSAGGDIEFRRCLSDCLQLPFEVFFDEGPEMLPIGLIIITERMSFGY